MLKSQLITTVLAVVFCILLAFAPKYVVDNDKSEESISSTVDTHELEEAVTHAEIPGNLQDEILVLKEKLNAATTLEESNDALVAIIDKYNSVDIYDSAAYFADVVAEKFPSSASYNRAGDLYYEAFTYAVSNERVKLLSSKVRDAYNKAEEFAPLSLDARVRVGMTYISGENPMQGITMIREVLNEDPDNRLAIFNLGVLSMQSGQYDKAVDRFKKLTELDTENIQARFYLGVCYMETGDKPKAKEQFLLVKEQETNPDILQTVDSYLAQLK
ncbi:MAG: peptidase [Thalassobius sp.]|nr:peptidase [Thalassovita sp.]